jgi:large subunit ribosomal protein L34
MLYTTLMSQTYQPNKRKRAKSHGFLVRSRTKTGKNVITRRRRKGRAKLTV